MNRTVDDLIVRAAANASVMRDMSAHANRVAQDIFARVRGLYESR